MFALRDEKALFRIGGNVCYDYHPGSVFKVTAKHWSVEGCLRYTVENDCIKYTGVRQKDLTKEVA